MAYVLYTHDIDPNYMVAFVEENACDFTVCVASDSVRAFSFWLGMDAEDVQ